MLTNHEFYVNYSDYSTLITKMQEKLLEAKKRNKNGNYSDAEQSIETLQRLQLLFHRMYHDQQTIENESTKVMIERKKLLDKIHFLEKENKILKENINL